MSIAKTAIVTGANRGLGLEIARQLVREGVRVVIPYSGGKTFYIKAESIEFQKTMVPVLEVGAVKKDFMGEFGEDRYAMYDKGFNPKDMIKFGDLSKPSLAGNWE